MDRENFGEVLRQAREAQGLTKTELAALLLDALGLELVIKEKGGETHG